MQSRRQPLVDLIGTQHGMPPLSSPPPSLHCELTAPHATSDEVLFSHFQTTLGMGEGTRGTMIPFIMWSDTKSDTKVNHQ